MAIITVISTRSFHGNAFEKQISFPAGTEFLADSSYQQNGWMAGSYLGQKGWFPSSYVQAKKNTTTTLEFKTDYTSMNYDREQQQNGQRHSRTMNCIESRNDVSAREMIMEGKENNRQHKLQKHHRQKEHRQRGLGLFRMRKRRQSCNGNNSSSKPSSTRSQPCLEEAIISSSDFSTSSPRRRIYTN